MSPGDRHGLQRAWRRLLVPALVFLLALAIGNAAISSADPPPCPAFVAAGNSPLDVEAAYEYACDYASSRNPGYFSYANDAANFASQLLVAAGALPSQGDPTNPIAWWTRPPSAGSAPPQHTESWSSVRGLYRYLIDSGIAHELPSGAQTLADTQAGDLIFWDWAPVGGTLDDVGMIVSGDGSDPATEMFVSHADEGAGGGWSPIGGMHSMEDLLDDRLGAFLNSLTSFNTTKYGTTGACPNPDAGMGGSSGQCWRWRIVRLDSTTRDGHAGPTRPRETGGGGNPSEAPCQPCAGDPVNTATGELTETVTDLELRGRGPRLSLERTYGAHAAATAGRFGYGWSDSYGMHLDAGPDMVTIDQENGSRVEFTLQSDGSWDAPSRVFATLEERSGGGWTFTRADTAVFVFDANGRLVSETDPNGYETTLGYDGSGRLTDIASDAGTSLTFAYSGAYVTSATAGDGRTVGYRYDGQGNLVEVTDVVGAVMRYGYDADHLLTTRTRPRGGVTTNTYDVEDRVVEQEDPLGNVTRWSYALDETMTGTSTVITPEGVVTLEQFVAGNIVAETIAHGTAHAATTRYAYDPVTNQQTNITDPLGNVVTRSYDGDGNRTSETDPLGNTTRWTYNRYGQVTSMTPPATYGGNAATTTYIYDEPAYSSGGGGNLTTVRTPILGPTGDARGTQTVRYVHGDPAAPSDVTSMIDARGNTWRYAYDRFGNQVRATAPATSNNSDVAGAHENERRWAFDSATGWLVAALSERYVLANPSATTCTPPATGCTRYTRDNYGRATQVTDAAGETIRTHYDGDGNVDYTVDELGLRFEHTFDRDDRLTVTTRPDSTTERIEYGDDGLPESRTDALGNETHYTYDARGSIATVTDPNERVTTFVHDAARRLRAQSDPNVSGCTATSTSAGCTTFGYDAAGRQTSIDYNDSSTPDVTAVYDGLGRRTSMSDGSGTSRWQYDSLGRVTQETSGGGAQLGYEYDAAGALLELVYPGSVGSVERSYDAGGRVASITDWDGNVTTFSYASDGALTHARHPTTAGTLTDSVGYDAIGRSTAYATTVGARTLATFDYDRDDAGKVLEELVSGGPPGGIDYDYDDIGRMTDAGAATYQYDGAGRPTTLAGGIVQAYDPAGQIRTARLGATTATFTYDDRGQRTRGAVPGQSPSRYEYDQAGNLRVVTTPSSATVDYGYDGDGLRSTAQTTTGTTTFTWDRSSTTLPLLLSDGERHYLYGPSGLPLEHKDASTGDVVWYHHDQLGSTRLLTDEAGAVAGQLTYDAYGTTVSASGTDTPLGYAGEYADPTTGLIYLRARHYDPVTAQFLTRDPAEDLTGDPYGYADSDPVNNSDPSGLCAMASASRIPSCTPGHRFDINDGSHTFNIQTHISNAKGTKGVPVVTWAWEMTPRAAAELRRIDPTARAVYSERTYVNGGQVRGPGVHLVDPGGVFHGAVGPKIQGSQKLQYGDRIDILGDMKWMGVDTRTLKIRGADGDLAWKCIVRRP